MPDESLEDRADRAAQEIRRNAIYEAAKEVVPWLDTRANLAASTNAQMALMIAEVTRVTADKIHKAIMALSAKPPPSPPTELEWVEVACRCGSGSPGCPQGKLDGNCSIWMLRNKTV